MIAYKTIIGFMSNGAACSGRPTGDRKEPDMNTLSNNANPVQPLRVSVVGTMDGADPSAAQSVALSGGGAE